jgi:glycosyltransferase involved in cell wall biosynthesis
MKILHAPTNTGGNPARLSRAEREIGLISDVMVFDSNWLNYPADINLNFNKLNRLQRELVRDKFIINAIRKYDVFNFNFAETLLNFPRLNLYNVDLPILKMFRKKILVIFQGCDMRLKGYSKENFKISACSECIDSRCTEKSDIRKQEKYKKFKKYAKKIYSLNPDLINYYPDAEFLPYAGVDLEEWIPHRFNKNSKIKIIHAPTDRGKKGTRYVEETVEKIKEKGINVELIIVEGLPYEKVKEIYNEADIAVDQLLVGWYGSFAVEMMALEKPVVCYIREEDLKFIPSEMKEDLPVVHSTKDDLFEKLIMLIENSKLRKELGEKGRNFVEKWHNSINIAKKLREEVYIT